MKFTFSIFLIIFLTLSFSQNKVPKETKEKIRAQFDLISEAFRTNNSKTIRTYCTDNAYSFFKKYTKGFTKCQFYADAFSKKIDYNFGTFQPNKINRIGFGKIKKVVGNEGGRIEMFKYNDKWIILIYYRPI